MDFSSEFRRPSLSVRFSWLDGMLWQQGGRACRHLWASSSAYMWERCCGVHHLLRSVKYVCVCAYVRACVHFPLQCTPDEREIWREQESLRTPFFFFDDSACMCQSHETYVNSINCVCVFCGSRPMPVCQCLGLPFSEHTLMSLFAPLHQFWIHARKICVHRRLGAGALLCGSETKMARQERSFPIRYASMCACVREER